MKIKNIFMLCSGLLLSGALLTSCSDDDEYDFDGISYQRAYIENFTTLQEASVTKTPVGYVVDGKALIKVRVTRNPTKDVHVTLAVDNSLVDAYNQEHGTSYLSAPEGAFTFENLTLTIPTDTVASADTLKIKVKDEESVIAQFNDKAGYLLPIVIIGCDDANYRLSSNASVTYVYISYGESSINDHATEIPGTAIDGSTVTCLEAENLNPSNVSGFFETGWSGGWSFLAKQGTASFTLDFGEVKNVTAFYIDNNLVTDANVEISADGTNWIELGNTSKHTPVAVGTSYWDRTYAYVLYAAIPARYMRAKMTLDESSWYWDYMQWGYCTASGAVYTE